MKWEWHENLHLREVWMLNGLTIGGQVGRFTRMVSQSQPKSNQQTYCVPRLVCATWSGEVRVASAWWENVWGRAVEVVSISENWSSRRGLSCTGTRYRLGWLLGCCGQGWSWNQEYNKLDAKLLVWGSVSQHVISSKNDRFSNPSHVLEEKRGPGRSNLSKVLAKLQ